METCPVGVAVLDAATGAPLSLNREARRIMAGLDMADSTAERLREAVSCLARRRTGGHAGRSRQRRDGACRGGRDLGPWREERAHAD